MTVFFVHLILLAGCSGVLATRIVAGWLDRVLAAFVLFWANLFITGLVLSAFHQLGEQHLYFRTSLGLALLCTLLTSWLLRPAQPEPVTDTPDAEASPFASALLLVSLALAGAVSAYVGFRADPNNFDSLTYHLPRIFLYLGQGDLGHYETANARLIFFPFGASLLQMLPIIHGESVRLLSVGNCLIWLIVLIAIYRIGRECGAGPFASLLGAWMGGLATEVLAQASTTTNDLQAAAPLLVAFLFSVKWWRHRRLAHALLAGAAFGLAVSVKLTVTFFLPATAFLGAILLWRYLRSEQRLRWRRDLAHIAAAGVLAAFFVLPFLIINYAGSGQFMTHDYDYTLNRPFSLGSMVQTMGTFGAQFLFDPVQRLFLDTPDSAAWQSANTGLNSWINQWFVPRWNPSYAFSELYVFTPDLTEDHVWFGFLGLVLLATGAVFLFQPRLWTSAAFWCVALSAGWFVAYCASSKWSLYNHRYMVPAVLLAMPAVAIAYERALRMRAPWNYGVLLCFGLAAAGNLILASNYLHTNRGRGISRLFVHGGVQSPGRLGDLGEKVLSENERIHFVYAGNDHINEPLYLLMDIPGEHRFTLGKDIRKKTLNVISHWSPSNSAIYSNIATTSAYTLVPVPDKTSRGVVSLGTIRTIVESYNYYGYGGTKSRPREEYDHILLTVEMPGMGGSDRLRDLRIQLVGLSHKDNLRAQVYCERPDGSREPLFTTTDAEIQHVSIAGTYSAIGVELHDAATGARRGAGRLPVLEFVGAVERREMEPLREPASLVAHPVSISVWSSGFGPVEGRMPEHDIPIVRWAKQSVATIEFKQSADSPPLTLVFSCRPQIRANATMEVAFNGATLGRFDFSEQFEWQDHRLELPAQEGINRIEFRFTSPPEEAVGDAGLQMIFRDLRLVPR